MGQNTEPERLSIAQTPVRTQDTEQLKRKACGCHKLGDVTRKRQRGLDAYINWFAIGKFTST